MTMKTWMLVMSTVVAMGSIGCAGSAQIVRRGSYSGELALTGGTHASMDAAQLAILEHCGGRARFVTDGEARALAATDPGVAKPSELRTIEGERLHYVCVTLATSASR